MVCSDQGKYLVDLVAPSGEIVQTDVFGSIIDQAWSPDSQWFLIQTGKQLWVDRPADGARTLIYDAYRTDTNHFSRWFNVAIVNPKK
jgi:hypothetical protein